MSAFYNEDDYIEINFNYFNIFQDEKKIAVKIDPNGEETFTAKMYPRRFDMIQMIIEDCTVINHINGNTMLKSSLFKKNFIKYMVIEWNQYDETGKIIEINDYNINRLDDRIIKHIIKVWNKVSGDKPLFEEL